MSFHFGWYEENDIQFNCRQVEKMIASVCWLMMTLKFRIFAVSNNLQMQLFDLRQFFFFRWQVKQMNFSQTDDKKFPVKMRQKKNLKNVANVACSRRVCSHSTRHTQTHTDESFLFSRKRLTGCALVSPSLILFHLLFLVSISSHKLLSSVKLNWKIANAALKYLLRDEFFFSLTPSLMAI